MSTSAAVLVGGLLVAAALCWAVARPPADRLRRDVLRPAPPLGGGAPSHGRARPGTDGRRRGSPPRRARAPTTDEVASTMTLLAVALQSGCGVAEAIEETARVAAPAAAAELSVVAAALRWGLTDDQAWAEADPRWRRAALALRLARAAGVPPAALLTTGADDLRADRLAAVDAAGARLGVRLVVPLGLAFLPAFVLTTVVPVVLALARQVLAPP